VLLKWVGIAVGAVVVVLLFITIAGKFGGNGETQQIADDKATEGQHETLIVDTTDLDSQMLTKSSDPVVSKPEVKQQETVKPEIPTAIQNEFQKPAVEKKPEPVKATSAGDNAIVITTYTKKDDLVPVVEYFKANGIATEIIQEGSYYYVVSQSRFDTVNTPGSEGYKLKQKIKQVGANYKAPAGFERFASKPFQDVYGKKLRK